jgi:hypothetical protein
LTTTHNSTRFEPKNNPLFFLKKSSTFFFKKDRPFKKIVQQFRTEVYVYTKEDTNIYLSKGLEKIAKEKSISVAELVRRIIDRDLDREEKQKG